MRVVVAPAIWNLEKRATSRIFQEKSVPDILKEVLEGAGVASAQQDVRIGESHPTRKYVVQYRETDLDFLLRLAAEEGIYFAVHTVDGRDVVVLGDAPDGLGDVEGTATLPFFEDFGFEGPSDRVIRLSRTVSVETDKVALRDYNPEKPSLQIEGIAEGADSGAHELEVYEYPARAADAAEAERFAQILLHGRQAARDVVEGVSGSIGLLPGLRFSIEGHPYEPLNREYLVVRTRIAGSRARQFERGGVGGEGRGEGYTCHFWGVPTATSPYRPKRRARAKTIVGAQTAITTGASGEEIHTDAAGQVKVSYPWDREGKKDDTSSRWIRTSQIPTGGSMMLPRVGWEVTLRHEDGDADRPLVMGRVYNALTPPPYALPDGAAKSSVQTATTPGGGSTNEFRMSDAKGTEEMFFNASKDMTTDVKNNATESVANDSKKKVGANQAKNVTNSMTTSIGANQTLDVGGNQTVKVQTFMVDEVGGDHSLSIGGNRDLKVGGDHKRDVGGSSTLDVGGNQIDLVVGSVTEETLASYNQSVGAALIDLAVGNRTVTVAGSRDESTGAAKIIAVNGGRGVEVGGSMNLKVAGAIINVASADKVDGVGGTYTELAAGAQIVKANNAVFEADAALTLVMGASILSLTPASVAIIGVSAKLDGDVTDTGALIVDN
jgi:type VI secretion system secreted protein VgrG